LSELQAARLAEPPLKVVVYTQYTAIRDACVANLERLGYDLYHVNDSMDGREDALQKFQCDRRENPAVLILQLNGSNLRFKPPAAKRVYLMEPFLDPAVEAKVTEQEGTLVARRFVYRYSAESNIVELHKQIEAGQVSLEKSGSFLPPAAIQILTKGMPQCNTKNDASETRLLNV
jgi:SNF2 family DNA or RNA helicase